MNRMQIKKKVENLTTLPTLPSVAMELNRMLQDVETPIERLVGLLEKDQSLVLKILRLVNSSFFGFKNRITNLRHAVTLLGYETVQNAVLTVSVIDALKLEHDIKGFNISTFWCHAVNVAVMCRHLAVNTRLAAAEEAFTAGLIHDIGKVVLINVFPEVFIHILETMHADSGTFYQAEQKIDTYAHTRIGSHLARRWMLPGILEQAIRYHHGPAGQVAETPMAELVSLADTLVNIMADQAGYRLVTERISPANKNKIMAVLKDSNNWFPAVRTEMKAASAFFQQR